MSSPNRKVFATKSTNKTKNTNKEAARSAFIPPVDRRTIPKWERFAQGVSLYRSFFFVFFVLFVLFVAKILTFLRSVNRDFVTPTHEAVRAKSRQMCY
jgi:hypothetical protein